MFGLWFLLDCWEWFEILLEVVFLIIFLWFVLVCCEVLGLDLEVGLKFGGMEIDEVVYL